MTKRFLAACFGAVLFGILTPILYPLLFSVPFDSLKGFVLLAVIGVGVGAFLGALYPRVFGFIFECFMDF